MSPGPILLHIAAPQIHAPRRSFFLMVSANSDGSAPIDATDPARYLVLLGDPESNVLMVGEVPTLAE